MRPLFKTTIVIWSESNPTSTEISALARDAESGDSYCSKRISEPVADPSTDPDWDSTEFFGAEDE